MKSNYNNQNVTNEEILNNFIKFIVIDQRQKDWLKQRN